MARQITNITHTASAYDILSQTPKNYNSDNYFIKELQDKVNAEWPYRPNRIDIFYENDWGEQTYSPIEVVIQSVLSEKGEEISDDRRRIVFRDILERRFKIGSRFSIGELSPETITSSSTQNTWLSTNTDSVKMTSSMIIERCNGTLGSLYTDAQGVSHYHYEPVIQRRNMSGARLGYNETAIQDSSQITITAQYNDYTRRYFINQRFIIGAPQGEKGSVYRIVGIDSSYSQNTFDPSDVGLMVLYLEHTEVAAGDDFERRIASQTAQTPVIVDEVSVSSDTPLINYHIGFTEPATIPLYLLSEAVVFKPGVVASDQSDMSSIALDFTYSLENLPQTVDPAQYITITWADQTLTISRKRIYLRGDLILIWSVPAERSPSGSAITAECRLSLRRPE